MSYGRIRLAVTVLVLFVVGGLLAASYIESIGKGRGRTTYVTASGDSFTLKDFVYFDQKSDIRDPFVYILPVGPQRVEIGGDENDFCFVGSTQTTFMNRHALDKIQGQTTIIVHHVGTPEHRMAQRVVQCGLCRTQYERDLERVWNEYEAAADLTR